MASYAVLLTDPNGLDTPLLAEALAAQKEIPIQDAMISARHGWGFAGMDLEESAAQKLTARLKEKGLASKTMPMTSLPPLPEPLLVSGLLFQSASLELQFPGGKTEDLPFERLSVLSAAGIPTTTIQTTKVKEGPSGLKRTA